MKERTSQILFGYWNEVRAGRIAPRRFEIEPARIASILSETFILERQETNEFRFRLAGTRICEIFGREFRGENMLELWSPTDQRTIERMLFSITTEGAVAVADLLATTDDGRHIKLELVMLPLLHTNDQVNRVLGSLSTSEMPAWLGSCLVTNAEMKSFNLIWPDGRPHALLQGMHRTPPFAPVPRDAQIMRTRQRTFKVYQGGRSTTPTPQR